MDIPERRLFDLTGQTAIVTGGGTHIGKSIARALAAFGAKVHIASRRFDVCKAAAEELQRDGLDCTPHQCDAANESEVEQMVSAATAEGTLDIAVANAGGTKKGPPAPNVSMDRWQETIRTSATTAFVTAQVAARRMIPQKHGRIILISSIHGIVGSDSRVYGERFVGSASDYFAAKAAVVNLTRSLACEFGQNGITVNCISPGQIPWPGTDLETVERFRMANPLRRTGVASDMQGAAVLLASDAGRFITGHNLVVDGGWTAW